MFHAHLKGKFVAVLLRGLPTVDSVTLEGALRESEDVLTAAVFSRLMYLPHEIAWDVVVGSGTVLIGIQPERPKVAQISQRLWPKYYTDPKNPSSYVEPDVVWLVGGVAVVIEAKWRDSHSADQLHREHDAVSAGERIDAVVVIALGNTPASVREELTAGCRLPSLQALSWPEVYKALVKVHGACEHPPHASAVLKDLLLILASRGMTEPVFLESLFPFTPAQPLASPGTLMNLWRSP